ncbi:MAG: hypothetical protein WA252_13635 [Candidatus Sulfotelmatobacter sp.]|jgi:hypothetical protein
MRKTFLLVWASATFVIAGYICGVRNARVVHAAAQENPMQAYAPVHGSVPKSYGRLVTAIPDQIGTGLIFEDDEGVIRFVSMTGMKEGELARYDHTPTHGGIPKSYGHLVAAVVNPKGTGLVFEDSQGAIRLVTITGKMEGELTRN